MPLTPTERDRLLLFTAGGCTGARGIDPADLVRNARLGQVDVDPRSGLVTLDGAPMRSEPAQDVSLSRLYFLRFPPGRRGLRKSRKSRLPSLD
ncbi:hypothetical protein R1T08_39605 [Streptomyces sp. SBC-4]|nr:hypothetical protein [Streptomyces sp. SBC-4]MDV5150039.1 hypothetical protein [Streptomyces sp. SBC-4]